MMRLVELLSLTEDIDFEVKKAQGRDGKGEVPQSFWETYSAMANTDGGAILLGADEAADRHVVLVGLKDPARVRKALWDNLNNRQQISANPLVDGDVQIAEQDGKKVLWVKVPRVAHTATHLCWHQPTDRDVSSQL